MSGQAEVQDSACAVCHGVGWVCAGTNKPADFEHGTCCNPSESEEFSLGPGCPSADGCPAGCAVGVSLVGRIPAGGNTNEETG